MIIKLTPPITKNKIDDALASFNRAKNRKSTRAKSLAKFFGISKTGMDGLQFQNKLRNEWD